MLERLEDRLYWFRHSIYTAYRKRFPLPDTRTPEQKRIDDRMSSILKSVGERVKMIGAINYQYDKEFSDILGAPAYTQRTIRIRRPNNFST